MPTYPHLPYAPIHEAVIDVRVALPTDFDVNRLNETRALLERTYPLVEQMRFSQWEFKADVAGGAVKPAVSGMRGVLFKSADQTRVVQCRVDGFTFSRLRPYASFEESFGEFAQAWTSYAAVTQPMELTRIALRYINRFSVPSAAPVSEYLNGVPEVPIEKASLATFQTRQSFALSGSPVGFNLITAKEPARNGTDATLVVDVDVFQISGIATSIESLAHSFEPLRALKNDVFFRTVTARSIEEFKREPRSN